MINIKFYIILFSILNCLLLSIHGNVNVAKQLTSFKNQFLPVEYRNTNFTIDDLRRLFHAKCNKVSKFSENIELYQDIEKSANQLVACFNDLFNVTAMQEEINAALPVGELDTVFHKYCAKAPQAEKCFRDFNDVIQLCLTENEQSQNRIMLHLASTLLDFMCTRGGDHLALFVAEEGPECLEENKELIAQCANESFSDLLTNNSVQTNLADLHTLTEWVLQPELCKNLNEFETCTIHYLEQCREITPANLAESIFRYIKNGTNCKNWVENHPQKNPVWRQSSSASSLVAISILFNVLISIFANII